MEGLRIVSLYTHVLLISAAKCDGWTFDTSKMLISKKFKVCGFSVILYLTEFLLSRMYAA